MDYTDRLSKLYTGAIHDVMRSRGISDFTLPHGIRPIVHGLGMAGPIFTISGKVVRQHDPHETLLAWTSFLSRAPSGHVVVCQANDDQVAHMGELSAETLHSRGVRGYITDGGCRDLDFIESIGFPVYARYATPRDVVGYWMPDTMGEPIRIGDVAIRNGDYALADKDGTVVVPSDAIADIVQETEAVVQTESKVRKAILEGEDPQKAYLTFGKF